MKDKSKKELAKIIQEILRDLAALRKKYTEASELYWSK